MLCKICSKRNDYVRFKFIRYNQPIDVGGIASCFKKNLESQYNQFLIDSEINPDKISREIILNLVTEAWNNVGQSAILSSWRKAEL